MFNFLVIMNGLGYYCVKVFGLFSLKVMFVVVVVCQDVFFFVVVIVMFVIFDFFVDFFFNVVMLDVFCICCGIGGWVFFEWCDNFYFVGLVQ